MGSNEISLLKKADTLQGSLLRQGHLLGGEKNQVRSAKKRPSYAKGGLKKVLVKGPGLGEKENCSSGVIRDTWTKPKTSANMLVVEKTRERGHESTFTTTKDLGRVLGTRQPT